MLQRYKIFLNGCNTTTFFNTIHSFNPILNIYNLNNTTIPGGDYDVPTLGLKYSHPGK